MMVERWWAPVAACDMSADSADVLRAFNAPFHVTRSEHSPGTNSVHAVHAVAVV